MSDVMCKTNSGSIINGRDVDTVALKFVNKSQIMIGSHTNPSSIITLTSSKILSLEITKKNEFSFGSLLTYLYLCHKRRGIGSAPPSFFGGTFETKNHLTR